MVFRIDGTGDGAYGFPIRKYKGAELKGLDPMMIPVGGGKYINPEAMKELSPPRKVTPETRKAKAELDKKYSSTGLSYANAEKKIAQIRKKYTDSKYFTTERVLVKGPKGPAPIMYKAFESDEIADFNKEYDHFEEVKKFDPSKLPEPDRSEYMDAVASKKEIEYNNSDLAYQAAPSTTHPENDDYVTQERNPMLNFSIDKDGNIKEKEITPKQKEARDKFNKLATSNYISYKEATETIEKIKNKYKDAKYQKFVSDPNQDPGSLRNYGHSEIDVNKIPEPDKSLYLSMLNAAMDIEAKNSALFAQTGLEPHEDPFKIDSSAIIYH